MESLREIFIKLGLSVEGASFAEGLAWEHALEKGAEMVVEAAEWMGEAMVDAIEDTAAFGEEMEVLAQKTGIGVEAIQRLGYAASLSHSSAEELQQGLVHLASSVEKAKDGGEEAQKTFSKLGISMDDVRRLNPEQLFSKVADRFKDLGDSQKRAALARELLGRGGVALIPTLARGAEGLKEMGIEAEELGVIMSEDNVHANAAFKESLEKVEQVVIGLKHELAGPLIEALAPIATGILEWVKANRQLISQRVQAFAQGVITVARVLGTVAVTLGKAVFWLTDHLRLLAVVLGGSVLAALIVANGGLLGLLVNFALNSAAAIAFAAVSTWAALSAAAAWLAAAAPVVLIAAGLILAALAAEDFYTFIKGGDSVLGHLLNTYGERFTKFMDDLIKPQDSDGWVVSVLKSVAGWLLDIEKTWDRLGSFVDWLAYGGDKAHHVKGALEGFSKTEIADNMQEQRDRVRTMQAIYGGGGTPGASAEAAQAGANYVNAPNFSASVVIQQGPGQSAGAVADQVTSHMDDWWDTKMRQAAPLAAVPSP